MALQQLLKDITVEDFVGKYLHRVPFAQAGGAAEYAGVDVPATLERLLASDDLDFLLSRRGELLRRERPPAAAELTALLADGYTFTVRQAERHDPNLERIAASFHEDFRAPINIHLYCTPGGQHGFGWHYDAEDVFILQAAGRKRYGVRKNTVNPWPTIETIPPDMRYERETSPELACTLAAGDWLYIANGYWHRADTEGEREPAVSLAVGVLFPSGLDLYKHLARYLYPSLLWRQRLPPLGAAGGDASPEARFRSVFAELAKDLERLLGDPEVVRGFVRALEDSPPRGEGGA